MKITKKDSLTEYSKIVTTHIVIVNGREIRIYESDTKDYINNDYDYDCSIDEQDIETLTATEEEDIDEYMTEILALKDGQSIEVKDL